jgi:mono/diheme cytochrome c family protein
MQFLQGMSDSDIQAISDYLNSFEAITGQERYIAGCAGCHGIDARGGRVGESVRGESAGKILESIREERPMGYLGCLPASDVKDIGNYLQSIGGGGSEHHSGDDSRHEGDDSRRKRKRRD